MIDFLPTPAGWAKDAACTQSDPEAWFPSTGQTNGPQAREAKRICVNVCPVREECLQSTLAQDELPRYGIWAGYSPEDLRRLAKGNKPKVSKVGRPLGEQAECGTYAGWISHKRTKTAMCDGCRDARNEYQRANRATKDAA